MQGDSRNSTFARVGRSYPRPIASAASVTPRRGRLGSYRVAGALIALLSALGLIGWFLAR